VSTTPTPDDLYVIYTGGTTGMPKGVLWRQADVAVAMLSLIDRRQRSEYQTFSDLIADVRHSPSRTLPCAPLMHGASQWTVLGCLGEGNTIVFPSVTERFDASSVLAAVQCHQVSVITIVGDAFAQPLVAALEQGCFDTSSLHTVVSGGAPLHTASRQRLQQLIPNLRVIENVGSSESGIQGSRHSQNEQSASEPFTPDSSTVVVAEDFASILAVGDDTTGWLARGGRIPLGYLGDPVKTRRTFPIVDGRRLTIPGDRVRLLADARIELLGRDSLTINTGGEKVFVEEVEAVLKDHPGVIDALVCGRPSPRWGSEVAAVVQSVPDIDVSSVLQFCRERLARYKVPKSVRVVQQIRRNPAGKGDYRWATKQVMSQELITPSTHQDGSQL
jgi:3-oxocholest-4-en-26-oate---CoA ligase